MEPGRKVYWTLRYRLGGVDREMSLGSYPEVSLADASGHCGSSPVTHVAAVEESGTPIAERPKC
jgi:hypothetical protein